MEVPRIGLFEVVRVAVHVAGVEVPVQVQRGRDARS